MNARLRIAVVLLGLAGLTGTWLVLAPFVTSYQAVGEPWITATTNHVVTGATLISISLVTILTVIGTALRALDEPATSP